MKRNIFSLIIFLISIIIVNPQCKIFVNSLHRNKLYPYVWDEQHHTAILEETQQTHFYKTLSDEYDYKIVVYHEEHLAGVEFKVLNSEEQILFSNEYTHKMNWDFSVDSTQQFLIKINVLETHNDERILPKNNPKRNGCVVIMFGRKEISY